jgi:transcriptional regulator with XRE-family HTH domain
MFYGDEHLGKAVSYLRASKGVDQTDLARKLNIKPGTLSQYESGRRGMPEDFLARVAEELELEPIQIWDTSHRIFRFNYFLEWAAREGTTVEELIARTKIRPPLEQILESYDARAEHDRRFMNVFLQFLDSLGMSTLGETHLLQLVVKPRAGKTKRRKAVGFDHNRLVAKGKTPARE